MSKSPASPEISRRDFVNAVIISIGALMGVVIGIPAVGYLIGPALNVKKNEAWVPLGPLVDYPIGTPTFFSFTRSQVNGWEKTVNSYGVFVVRKDDTHVQVLSNICTHLGCRVSWHTDLQHYVSPCHNGHFDIIGNVVSGPPPRPLDEFTTKIEAGSLYILYPPFERS